jgi:hypothetical protein
MPYISAACSISWAAKSVSFIAWATRMIRLCES